MASRIIRRDSAAFWAFAERVSQKMESWPEWQRRAADAVFITPPERRAPETRDDGAPAREVRRASSQG